MPYNQIAKTPDFGCPLRFQTPEELEQAFNKYFDNTPIEKWTITGLCLEVGSSRSVLMDYSRRREFQHVVSRARMKVENAYELALRDKGGIGNIFALKNFGWRDESQQEISGPGGKPLLSTPIIPVTPKATDVTEDQTSDKLDEV